jgi:hypothetical protein
MWRNRSLSGVGREILGPPNKRVINSLFHEGTVMARELIERVISDLSGKEIPAGQVWTMTLTPPDGRRNPIRLDITEAEAHEWASRGSEVKRRGRRPSVKSSTVQRTAGQRAALTRKRRGRAKKSAATRRSRKK